MKVKYLIALLLAIILGSSCVLEKYETGKKSILNATYIPQYKPLNLNYKLQSYSLNKTKLKEEPDVLFSVRLEDADIKDVLMALSEQSGINIVFSNELQGKISINLKNVKFSTLLQTILRTIGYDFVVEDNVVRVVKNITKIYKVNFVYPISSYGTQGFGQTSGGLGIGGGAFQSTTGTASYGARGGIGGGITSIFWQELEQTLKDMISKSGKVIVNPLSGLIIVRDKAEIINEIEKFLEEFNNQVRKQVMIEAKIIEVILNKEYDLGIDWQAPDLNLTSIHSHTYGKASQDLSNGEGIFHFKISSDHIQLFLDALAEQGHLNIISSPRITTLNNQEAVIRVAEDLPYYSAIVSGETGNVIGWQILFKKAGLNFRVTPQISDNNEILLQVNPSVSELVGYTSPSRAEPVPIVDVREASTYVKVKSGETVVIGGLMREKNVENISYVPLLGNIPFIGALFRKTSQIRKKSELVLLLTPYILEGEQIIKEVFDESKKRLDELVKGYHFGEMKYNKN